MYIIVAGTGAAGLHIASILAKEGQKVVIVEQSEELAECVRNQLDVEVIIGNATSPSVLRQAEVQNADAVVATSPSDETNMIICLIAKELGAKKTIARVRNPEYSGFITTPTESPYTSIEVRSTKKVLGVDLFINPEIEAAREIASRLSNLYATPVHEFARGHVQIREFKVTEKLAAVSKPLSEIELPTSRALALIDRHGKIKSSNAEIMEQGDYVYVMATKGNWDKTGDFFNHQKQETKNVVILGGGNIGSRVAEELHGHVQVKLIEKTKSRCEEIKAKLKGVEVVQGEGTDRNLLIEEGVPSSDAFVAAAGDDALNILAGLVVKKELGVPHAVVLVNNPEYIQLAQSVGIDFAVSPLSLAGNRITRYIHAGAVSVASLGEEKTQAIEFVVSKTAHIIKGGGKPVKLPEGAIMGAIIRGDTAIIPADVNTVQAGDHVVIVSSSSAIPPVEKLFK